MVDNDEFRRNVPKGFQNAARAVFNRVDRERPIRLAVRAAAAALKEGGCPGLNSVVGVVAASVADGMGNRIEAHCLALDRIARECADDRAARAVRTAKALMHTPALFERYARIDPARAVAEAFIVDLIDASIFTGRLPWALNESGKETIASYHGRRREFLDELRQSENVAKLAAELVADPRGEQVKRQRAKRRDPDPRAGLDLALTAD